MEAVLVMLPLISFYVILN